MVLLGPPASGKGTQGRLITERWGIPVASVGDILRREKEEKTALGKEASEYIDHGRLVPDRLALSSVESWLPTHGAAFIFDGFPRTVGQAEALDAILARRHAPLLAALWLEADEQTIRRRVSGRLVCVRCGHTFQLGWQIRERTDGCPNCGGELRTRHDDDAETLVRRMAQYREHTEPLIVYYQQRGLLRRIDGGLAPAEVFARIEAVFAGVDSSAGDVVKTTEVAT